MKKVLLILALVAIYGVSISTASAKVTKSEKAKITVVTKTDNHKAAPEGEKDVKAEKSKKASKSEAKSEDKSEAKSKGCSGAKSEGCSGAKSEGCSGKEKSGCGSGCSDKK